MQFDGTPSLASPSTQQHHHSLASSSAHDIPSPASSSANSIAASEDDAAARPTSLLAVRPSIGARKSSGTMIVTRDQPTVVDDEYDDGDVRTMSPRRNSSEVEKLSDDARRDLIEQAKLLQTSLQAIVERVETVREEHEKLEGGNKFLQSYIGELMQTSKITSTAPSKTKGKARPTK